MKNIDKIRQMSAEELAYCIRDSCLCCSNGECGPDASTDGCLQGIMEWLNQEDNPMPILKIRDIVETVDNRYVVLDNNVAISVAGKCCEKQPAIISEVNEIIENETISYIWRYSPLTRKFEKIWRADNEPHKWQDKQE